jgi:hypothetical protein
VAARDLEAVMRASLLVATAALASTIVVAAGDRASASPCGTPCGGPPGALSRPAAATEDGDRELIERGSEGDGGAPPGVIHANRLPSVAGVLSAAYAAAGLDGDPARGWIRRARLAGLVPWITVRTGRDTTWHDNDPVIGHGTALEVRATWRLDRLVFDGRELQVASIEAARRRERRRLASRVIRAYFSWRRAVGQAMSQPGAPGRIDEAAAELDALTDGWFSDELAEPRRSASESRTR